MKKDCYHRRNNAKAFGLKVLLVDDEPIVLLMTKLILERGGYDVVTAPSANEALKICDELKGELSLVITDVSMPGMNGRDLAKCVAALPTPLPVILMSGYTDTSPLLEGLKDGRVGKLQFIAKPFQAKEFLAVVSEALRKSDLQADDHLRRP